MAGKRPLREGKWGKTSWHFAVPYELLAEHPRAAMGLKGCSQTLCTGWSRRKLLEKRNGLPDTYSTSEQFESSGQPSWLEQW